MSLAVRVIPVLLQRGPSLVKGINFKSWRSVGHVRTAVKVYQARNVDELIFLDIAATPNQMSPDFQLIEEMTMGCFMPLTVGGGVNNKNDVIRLLRSGADKVCINTALFDNAEDIRDAVREVGSQCIVGAIDYDHDEVYSHCGRQRRFNYDGRSDGWGVVSWAKYCAKEIGVGEILLTAIHRDGTLDGYDLPMLEKVCEAVSIPVIANGGCGDYEHMVEAIKAGAHAVAASAFFQWTDATPRGASEYLKTRGINAR